MKTLEGDFQNEQANVQNEAGNFQEKQEESERLKEKNKKLEGENTLLNEALKTLITQQAFLNQRLMNLPSFSSQQPLPQNSLSSVQYNNLSSVQYNNLSSVQYNNINLWNLGLNSFPQVNLQLTPQQQISKLALLRAQNPFPPFH